MLLADINTIDPPTKAAMMLALLGIVLIGIALVVVILLGGRWVRRLGKRPNSQRGLEPKFRQTEILEQIRVDKAKQKENRSSAETHIDTVSSKETDTA